jgi:hypothetical protein
MKKVLNGDRSFVSALCCRPRLKNAKQVNSIESAIDVFIAKLVQSFMEIEGNHLITRRNPW